VRKKARANERMVGNTTPCLSFDQKRGNVLLKKGHLHPRQNSQESAKRLGRLDVVEGPLETLDSTKLNEVPGTRTVPGTFVL
jgi:hypothetical protein